jgi:hypothetical protein
MVAEPGESFRWGVLLRRSTLNKAIDERGNVTRFEDSTERQELKRFARSGDMIWVGLAGWRDETYRLSPQRPWSG